MDLMKLRSIQWLTIIGALAGIIGLIALWDSPWRNATIVFTLVTSALFFVIEVYKDRVSVVFSGLRRFHRTFPVQQNPRVFEGVQSEYGYLGVSFASVLVTFRAWCEKGKAGNVKIRLLLTDPEAVEALEFQARSECGIWQSSLSEEQNDIITRSVRKVQDAIRLTVDSVRAMAPAGPHIEIRYHREKLRKWMHTINGDLLYVGLLRNAESGLFCPVIELKKRHGKWSLFDHYHDEWEALWEAATPVPLKTSEGRAPRR